MVPGHKIELSVEWVIGRHNHIEIYKGRHLSLRRLRILA
jgi:hypothetical protein